MMGAGKTTIGRLLAQRTGCPFLDTDALVAEDAGLPIPEVFSKEGEPAFRDREANAIAAAAANHAAVVATGGGAVLAEGNIETMRAAGTVVWLQARPDTLAARIGSAGHRPLLAGDDVRATLEALLGRRWTAYERAAHHVVVTDDVSIEEAATLVEQVWNES